MIIIFRAYNLRGGTFYININVVIYFSFTTVTTFSLFLWFSKICNILRNRKILHMLKPFGNSFLLNTAVQMNIKMLNERRR